MYLASVVLGAWVMYPCHVLAELLVPEQAEAASASNRTAEQAQRQADSAVQWLDQPEDVEAILLPGRSSAPPSQRARARSYLQDADNGAQRPSEPVYLVPSDDPSTKDNTQRNLNKARQYLHNQDGEPVNTGKFVQIGTTRGVVGKDGVIEMTCDGVNNHAGHIGDDTRSGSVFTIMIAGKPAKARCK
jgi:hypothetical protein